MPQHRAHIPGLGLGLRLALTLTLALMRFLTPDPTPSPSPNPDTSPSPSHNTIPDPLTLTWGPREQLQKSYEHTRSGQTLHGTQS